jgi:hypothetical protein
MELASRFECWRELKGPKNSWGLAWFLAAEFARRFYSSHGLVPWVIEREGLGYYGIEINCVRCGVNDAGSVPLGRFTMEGNVENWRSGSPGDHGLELIGQCERGVPTRDLIRAAVAHLGQEPIPNKSHLSCRHKRWGSSYVLLFDIAAYLALQYEAQDLGIWNHPFHLEQKLKSLDAKASIKEHPGGFLFTRHDREVLVAGDGRVLDDAGDNLWLEYMKGGSISELAKSIDRRLDS